MNDETPINEEDAATERKRRLPGPVEAAWFAVQERVVWPLQDRFSHVGPGSNRALLGGGAAAVLVAGVALALALASGGGSSTQATTTTRAAAPREAAIAAAPKPSLKKDEAHRETLHGAEPVFSPPSSASKGAEKTGESKAVEAGAASSGTASSAGATGGGEADAGDSTSSTSTSSPADATISSDPKNSGAAASGAGPTAGAAAARAAVPDGPPAGPPALKVAREFAEGFVVYEIGGEASAFRDAFAASATPNLTKALLQRPPKQPAGVEVPRAKVLNVVAGPSQGNVYKVSVSLLRVGVTSELRLDMERTKTAGKTGEHGEGVEWRVTNVLG